MQYVHQLPDWPDFRWDAGVLPTPLGAVRHLQGKLAGSMSAAGFVLQKEALLETLTLDVVKSNEIEGSFLNTQTVRSSLARRLGMDISGLVPADRQVDGVVDMMLDATGQCDLPLTAERLFGWHAALFPTGRSGMYAIRVGAWRDDAAGPMRVVSGGMGQERVHFQAPDAALLDQEMNAFIDWFNKDEAP